MADLLKVRTGLSYDIWSFDRLCGWETDDHDAALKVFGQTSGSLSGDQWQDVAKKALAATQAKSFFETHFVPVRISDGAVSKFTGYYEPELFGSPVKTPRFRIPVLRMPKNIPTDTAWLSRREITTTSALQDQGLEICWVDDPVGLFFLQVQGSGRIQYPDGRFIRVGYAGKNGHPYQSIGRILVDKGVIPAKQMTAGVLKNWIYRHPAAGRDLMMQNASYVFFREITGVAADKGPIGTLQHPLTAMRSIAVDPDITPLGAPVWLETQGARPMSRLMVAQDTGSAIKGAQRADVFVGTGAEAGKQAGQMIDGGQMFVLMPKLIARELDKGAVC